jgi:hypothetical protein
MKQYCFLIVTIFSFGLLPVWAESDAPPALTGVAIAVVGEMPDAYAERVREFVQLNTSLNVQQLPALSGEGETLEAVLESLLEVRPAGIAALVLLYAGEGEFEQHSIYRYDHYTCIVNATAMRSDDEEQYLRRLEKLTMRGIGLLLDVPQVPNPQSAMWSYRTMEELDWMGRNFDPPSLMRLQQNAVAMGLPLIENSPFLIIEPRP